jgi:hypothetical protein
MWIDALFATLFVQLKLHESNEAAERRRPTAPPPQIHQLQQNNT